MSSLNPTDYVVIGGYFCLLMVLGLWFRRRAAGSLEEYFLAGRKMPWWAMGISGMASYVDMAGTMLIVSFLYMLGPRGLYIEFRGGAVLVLTFMLLWSGKWHYRSGCMTGAEWMRTRFGDSLGARLAYLSVVVYALVHVTGFLGYGLSIVLHLLAMRHVGAARQAAYFATAPFIGAVAAVPILGERLGALELGAGALMAAGAIVLLRARHDHWHEHEALEHDHAHVHDGHHAHAHEHEHEHEGAVDEPHAHPHRHAPLVHDHPHLPDAHHRHRH